MTALLSQKAAMADVRGPATADAAAARAAGAVSR